MCKLLLYCTRVSAFQVPITRVALEKNVALPRESVCVCKRLFIGEVVGDTEILSGQFIAFSDPGLVMLCI
jgi:hypothetical protein